MHLALSVHDSDSLLTVTGDVETVDVPILRGRILDALEANLGDVLLDMREAGTVSDQLMVALTAARARAKHLRHRIVVVDSVEGATTGSLRRLGMQFRIPIYRDPEAAVLGLRADREVRARLAGDGPPAPRPARDLAPDDVPRPHDDLAPDDEAPGPAVQAGRALWAAAAQGPPGLGGRT